MTPFVKHGCADGVLTIVLDRADRKNALTDDMCSEISALLEQAEKSDGSRVVLIRSEGELFSAGNDIGEFAAVASADGPPPANMRRFQQAFARSTRPIVAAVQGRAVGIGATLLLHCDYVVLCEDAQLTTPFVNLAIVPEVASSRLLPAAIGHVRAFAMFALGQPVTAQEALAWGLANKVVSKADLLPTAQDVARRLAAQPLGALVATKALMRDAGMIAAQLEAEQAELLRRLRSDEAREAFSAFAERRTPDFTRFS